MLEIDNRVVGALDLPEALERLLVAYGSLTLDEEVIAILNSSALFGTSL
jgi:hypothetical protein